MAVCAVLVCSALLTLSVTPDYCSAAEESVYVKVLVARVRQAPTTEAPILFRIKRGEAASLTRTQNDWYRIKISDGRSGWAHQSLFTKTDVHQQTTQGHIIQSVNHETVSTGHADVSFTLNGFHPPETFVLSGDKPRVVCDFMDTRVRKDIGPRIETGKSIVKDIRISPYGGIVPRVRIVLDLVAGPSYTVDQTFYKKENIYIVSIQTNTP